MFQYGITFLVAVLAAPALCVEKKMVNVVAFGCLFGWSCEAIGALVIQAMWMRNRDGMECAQSTHVDNFETGGTFEETGASMLHAIIAQGLLYLPIFFCSLTARAKATRRFDPDDDDYKPA